MTAILPWRTLVYTPSYVWTRRSLFAKISSIITFMKNKRERNSRLCCSDIYQLHCRIHLTGLCMQESGSSLKRKYSAVLELLLLHLCTVWTRFAAVCCRGCQVVMSDMHMYRVLWQIRFFNWTVLNKDSTVWYSPLVAKHWSAGYVLISYHWSSIIFPCVVVL